MPSLLLLGFLFPPSRKSQLSHHAQHLDDVPPVSTLVDFRDIAYSLRQTHQMWSAFAYLTSNLYSLGSPNTIRFPDIILTAIRISVVPALKLSIGPSCAGAQ